MVSPPPPPPLNLLLAGGQPPNENVRAIDDAELLRQYKQMFKRFLSGQLYTVSISSPTSHIL